MKKVEKIYRFLKQPSTKKGIVGVLGCFGIVLSPQHWEAISFGLIAVYSIYQIVRDEDKQVGR